MVPKILKNAQKRKFLNLVDHMALQDYFGGPRKKRRSKKTVNKKKFMRKVNEDKVKRDLRSNVILAWLGIKQALKL